MSRLKKKKRLKKWTKTADKDDFFNLLDKAIKPNSATSDETKGSRQNDGYSGK